MLELDHITQLFAQAMTVVDANAPVAHNARTKEPYKPGIGPHPERQTTKLVTDEFARLDSGIHADSVRLEVPYPDNGRARCDLVFGTVTMPQWAIELKMLRMLGDNGKPNDNMLMHILSPYPEHRSALTDCEKLLSAKLAERQAILIYAYDYDAWPAEPALAAFEAMAQLRVGLSRRFQHWTGQLIHPVHQRAVVASWEISDHKPIAVQ